MLKTYLLAFVATQHFVFLILEMFFWTKPIGLKIFNMSLAKAESSSVLAANQGLYNGFLVAGLIWSTLHPDPAFSKQLSYFFLSCVVVAGVFGGFTVSWRILAIQALPSLLVLFYIYFSQ